MSVVTQPLLSPILSVEYAAGAIGSSLPTVFQSEKKKVLRRHENVEEEVM